MSPHPRDFTDDVIEAMAETHNVMPHLHMPLQSGSNQILQSMRRSYRTDRYLNILNNVRTAMPHASITTDIIVGFPNETEAQFQGTLDLVEKVGFDATFTFIYSPRKGTPAHKMIDNVPYEEKQKRGYRINR
jgi:tRNA-2-methylthio-N6-dimethylallyladenosine synthase